MRRYTDDIEARLSGRHKKSIELCGDVRGQRILNVDCYNGWFERAMVERRCQEVIGIDIADQHLVAAQGQVPGATFVKASALALPFAAGVFDLVTLFDVIEHLPKGTEWRALSEAGRGLRDDGSLIVSVPNRGVLSNVLDPAWWLIGHRHYTPGQIVEMLKQEGLVERVERRGGLAELVGMLLLYVFKVLGREMPFKERFDRHRDEEYLGPGEGMATLFAVARRVAR
jgi:SAM-dependent methyltransferase